jgi:hypothetical protein
MEAEHDVLQKEVHLNERSRKMTLTYGLSVGPSKGLD